MLKVLICGMGNMGASHFRVTKKYLRSTEHDLKTCDTNPDLNPDYTDYKIGIDTFQPNYVIIATPTQTHETILDYCIEKMVPNVLVEKPIISRGNGTKYLGLKHTKLMVGHTERFNPMVQMVNKLIGNRKIETIMCTRSGYLNNKERLDLNTDLCIHDSDVCQLITRANRIGDGKFKKMVIDKKPGFVNIVVSINDSVCFFHADEHSPFKRREIKVMGPGYLIEGDYIKQRVWQNGQEISITRSEPLLNELETFFTNKFTETNLIEAIQNLEIVV